MIEERNPEGKIGHREPHPNRRRTFHPFVATLFISLILMLIEISIMSFVLPYFKEYPWSNLTILNAMLLPLLIMPVFYFLISKLDRRSKELELEIARGDESKKSLHESEKKLQMLSLRILDSQETERKRISRELHDELGGGLAVIKLRLSRIKKFLETSPAKAMEECQINLDYVDQVIDNVYRVTKDMTPAIIEDFGLTAGIHSLINNFTDTFPVDLKMEINNIDSHFKQEDRLKQIMVYRILQECLTNVIKHSNAKNVSITVRHDDGQAIVVVEDDGRGFDVKEALTKHHYAKGLGLSTMDERVRLTGGSLDVQSKKGEGTQVSFRIPIQSGVKD